MNTDTLKSKEEYQSAEYAELSKTARQEILVAATSAVEKRIWDPRFDRERWNEAVRSHRRQILEADDTVAFERELNVLIQSANEFARVSCADIGFFHERNRKRPERKGLATRFRYCQPNACSELIASEDADLLYSQLENGIGWLRVTKFPGAIGIEIANDIHRAIDELKKANCGRLIVDLRGNAGGGLGFLRLMSYLTPGRVVAGYSITHAGAEKGTPKEKLKVFDWVPSRKWALPWLILKYGLSDPSVCIVTEGLGTQPFHGRIAILVDDKTTGAGERIAAFARENRFATVVGKPTAGRLICSDSIKLRDGYFARVPARAWYTGQGDLLENVGVKPDVEMSLDRAGQNGDALLKKTVDLLCDSSARDAFAGLPKP
jgi:hypothetical protein